MGLSDIHEGLWGAIERPKKWEKEKEMRRKRNEKEEEGEKTK